MTYTRLVTTAAVVGVPVLGACTGTPTTDDRSVSPSPSTTSSSWPPDPRWR